MELYRVLLVDDEEDIRVGISRKMDWEGLGFTLVLTLLGAVREFTYFLAKGRVSTTLTMEISKNQTTCSHSGAPTMAESSAPRAPRANQMDTSPGTTPSTTSSTTISTSHTAGIFTVG